MAGRGNPRPLDCFVPRNDSSDVAIIAMTQAWQSTPLDLTSPASYNQQMPTISMFYGILVSMFFEDTDRHHLAHIHVRYAGEKRPLP